VTYVHHAGCETPAMLVAPADYRTDEMDAVLVSQRVVG
jgi:hypothetical protein